VGEREGGGHRSQMVNSNSTATICNNMYIIIGVSKGYVNKISQSLAQLELYVQMKSLARTY